MVERGRTGWRMWQGIGRRAFLVALAMLWSCGGSDGPGRPDLPVDSHPLDAAGELRGLDLGPGDLGVDRFLRGDVFDVALDTSLDGGAIPSDAMALDGPGTDLADVGQEDLCDVDGATCNGCLVDGDCGDGFHCTQGSCDPDKCEKGLMDCANDTMAVRCDEHGIELTFIPCAPGEICAWGNCAQKLCEPYAKWCTDDHYLAVCDGIGTGIQKVTCPAGMACFHEVCSPILHNLYVVFDTSGSMHDSVSCQAWNEPFCQHPWPVCEVMEGAYSPLGVSKKAFHTVFADQAAAGPLSNFVLFRFPDEVDGNSPSCSSGYYDNLSNMTGDDGSHVTPDGPESWFETHMQEVVSVPFPSSPGPANLNHALQWVDFVETFEPVGAVPCSVDSDCPGGACLTAEGTKLCHYHTNPELRAQGSTPLGKTMFYAGEYIRKFVVVDGRPCETTADCGNANYVCGPEGTCVDPVRHCRRNTLLLFTDGNDTENSASWDYFNPVVQAKRFHYGLGCQSDDDCLDGAVCVTPQMLCQPEGLNLPTVFNDSEQGANTLKDSAGGHIGLTIHVVHLGGGGGDNEKIAVSGGGQFYSVDQGDLPALIEALDAIVNAKDDLQVCVPQPLTAE
jgi:hypothetical protein